MAVWMFIYKKTAEREEIMSAVVRAHNEKEAKELFAKENSLGQSNWSQKIEDFKVERVLYIGDTEILCTETRSA